ncbi:protein tyrosine phosphatase family protein [Acinetobacter bohemicus]|uniref:Protein tyrosine phosphatase family protein n=1 Tax=Acinetobacter lwoffii TaxID=28090 RepID=A0A9D2USC6_ACILW|nr:MULTISPECIES: protein tyrosine phosphatase family protein [Acinetobacter]MDM1780377.1 protein tyrosine phosphatase family protein [Acinetobacter indicus]HJF27652.1 protein tyrosine phosphatase family protein [Acinetobacter lwoffii]MCO8042459.1 protein tyrosine phosphatase family protein [Acinetobacter sp. S4400-12]MCO8045277.1 protein tyrosine phosphatase family protein [Acinetobacter sp. S4397-1]MCU7224809.1 protein tyrosine phosphatase family protein [Acinetobacter bohemicus]
MNDIETALSQIENFQFIHEHLFSSGQPTAEQLKLMKEYGVSTVINVALTDSVQHLLHEDKICLDLGLNYIQLPISWERPSDDQCLLVLDLIDHLVKQHMVWVHCSKNYHVSCLMYLYRQYSMNIDMPAAQEYLHEIWEPNETWTGLMHAVALQLQGRKATHELELSLIHPHHFV